jgi:hypothetical protein
MNKSIFLFIYVIILNISLALPSKDNQNKDNFQCDDGWHWLTLKKTCIKIQDSPLNWADSESKCVIDGTHLISIGNAFEEDEL